MTNDRGYFEMYYPKDNTYGERPEHKYQSVYHKTSKQGVWYHVAGTEREVTDITVPHIPGGVKFYLVGGSTIGTYGPKEFDVLVIKMGINDRDTGEVWPVEMGLSSGLILPANYTPEQLAHRAAWLLRSAMDHEWREHFLVKGKRVFDPHARETGFTL